MARKQLNDGQEIIYQDLNALTSLLEKELYERAVFEMLQRTSDAFFQDAFLVNYIGATTVSVNSGVGFQTDNTQVSPESKKRMLFQAVSANLNLAPPDGSQDRIDIVCVKADRAGSLTESRKYKDPVSSVVSNQNLSVESEWTPVFSVVGGTPAGSPAVPATPAGYIKLAELRVHAVSGLASGADITDKRVKLPVGGDIFLNTLGYQRLPAGATSTLSNLMASIDALLKNGYQNYEDWDVLGADPAAPGAAKVRVYHKSGTFFFRDNGGTITPLGSGAGGGGGANWAADGASSPVEDRENGEKVWLFSQADAGLQKLTLFVKVPQSYIAGRQILMYIGEYSPSAVNTQLMSSIASLVKKDVDAIGSTANQRTSTNTALTNTVANQYRQPSLDLTDATGRINAVSVAAGDLIRVDLVRGTDTDTADIRFVPSATEVKFS
jgi:hypothetical protein